jgi:hypothetical protein
MVGCHCCGAMNKNTTTNFHHSPKQDANRRQRQAQKPVATPADERTTAAAYQELPCNFRPKAGRAQRDPMHYESHSFPSMTEVAEFLVLRFSTSHNRRSYYRQLRLLYECGGCDPAVRFWGRLYLTTYVSP